MSNLLKGAIRTAVCFAPYFAIVWVAYAIGGKELASYAMFWGFAAVVFTACIVLNYWTGDTQ